jgi:hypothetical protein
LGNGPPGVLLAPVVVAALRNMAAYADIAVELAERLMIGLMS